MSKAVIIYSGGMDSFTLLHQAITEVDELYALSFNYGQRHSKELERASAVCAKLNVNHRVVDLRNINALVQGSALTSGAVDVPEGHYAQENMKATVVPNRNMIMLSLAVGYAVSKGADRVYIGAHAGDHDIYPDCRDEFFVALNTATRIANYQSVEIRTPFIYMSKGDILVHGSGLGLASTDYAQTWTCYKGLEKACGKCGACVERLEAFAKAGWHDPLEYTERDSWREVLAAKK